MVKDIEYKSVNRQIKEYYRFLKEINITEEESFKLYFNNKQKFETLVKNSSIPVNSKRLLKSGLLRVYEGSWLPKELKNIEEKAIENYNEPNPIIETNDWNKIFAGIPFWVRKGREEVYFDWKDGIISKSNFGYVGYNWNANYDVRKNWDKLDLQIFTIANKLKNFFGSQTLERDFKTTTKRIAITIKFTVFNTETKKSYFDWKRIDFSENLEKFHTILGSILAGSDNKDYYEKGYMNDLKNCEFNLELVRVIIAVNSNLEKENGKRNGLYLMYRLPQI